MMKTFDYKYKITFRPGEKFDINYVIDACKRRTDGLFMIEVPNTIGLTQEMIRKLPLNVSCVRVAGGYNDERFNAYSDQQYRVKDWFDSSIYSKGEILKITQEIEKIEKGINPNWSDLQKIVYLYDYLKKNIMYDPKYESKESDEIRSLRGLLSKKTVCAGYATIFKEMLDRQNIKCHYVRGNCIGVDGNVRGGHAWNVIELDGKLYPIDLTWDNTRYRSGLFRTHIFLGQDIEDFNKKHSPDIREPLYGYQSRLSTINPNLISYLSSQISRDNDFKSTTYTGVRKDKSKFTISQIGEITIEGKTYYRFCYADVLPNGKLGAPIILYSDCNVTSFINYRNFNKDQSKLQYIEKIDNLIDEVLFSKQNISDSLNKGTFYIGGIKKNPNSNKDEYIENVSQIQKSKKECDLFKQETKRIKRSDGSVLLIQQMSDKPKNINGRDVNAYHIVEYVLENGKYVLKKVNIFSDSDLLSDRRQEIADEFLSRDRLDNIVNQTGGYVGRLNEHGAIEYDSNLAEYFDISKYIGMDGKKKKATTPLPTFEELHELLRNYEVYMDAAYLANPNGCLPKVIDIKTGETITDRNIINRVYLASVWVNAAGVKRTTEDKIAGEKYAFNDKAKEVYELLCKGMEFSAKKYGTIDTVGMFKHIEDRVNYKYSREIVTDFFKTPMQVELFNQMTYDSLGMEKPDSAVKPVPLYTMSHAGDLAYGGRSTMMS